MMSSDLTKTELRMLTLFAALPKERQKIVWKILKSLRKQAKQREADHA